MIRNAAEYDFVTGIMNNEVIIDGGIMPARDMSNSISGLMAPRCLRGEDICFLLESGSQRNTVMQQQIQSSNAYSKTISRQQVIDMRDNLIRNIRMPQSMSDNFYVQPDYSFTNTCQNIYDYVIPWTLDQHNFLTVIYPDCCMSSYVSTDPNKQLVSDDIRRLFYDAQMTREMMPTDNSWNVNAIWPLFPPAGSNVAISSTTTSYLTSHNWSGDMRDWGTPEAYNNSAVLYHYTGSGYQTPSQQNPGRFYFYWRSPTSFNMQVTVPQQILDYIDTNNITAIVEVYCMYEVATLDYYSYTYTYYYDLWGFPLTKRAQNRKVTIDFSDIYTIMDRLQQSVSEKGLPEFQWTNKSLLTNRLQCIAGCPLVVKLNDHTDFSSLHWGWSP